MALHSMGRQHGDHQMAVGGGGGASSSSIALLQARFRQLEKMREKREEMELLKLFSESQTIISRQTKQYEQTRNLLVHPHDEMIYHQPNATTTTKSSTTTTRSSSFQDSLSLELDLYGKKTEHDQPTIIRTTTPPFRDFWSMDSVSVSTSRAHEKPDVDTSLHL